MNTRHRTRNRELADDPRASIEGKRGRAALGDWCVGDRAAATATAVQFSGSPRIEDPDDVRKTARRAFDGSRQALPFLPQIQKAFGHIDLSRVEAFVGGPAAEANEALGSRAFATGTRVAFHDAPDLRTAAHEAAHLVQQHRQGFTESQRDSLEAHADLVADRVVAGESAAPLLGTAGPLSGAEAGIQFDVGEERDTSRAVTEGGDPTLCMVNERALQRAIDAVLEVVPAGQRDDAATSVPEIMRQAVQAGVTNADQVAYMLATAEHESRLGGRMRELRNGFNHNPNAAAGRQWSARNHVSGRTVTAGSEDALETAYWDDAYGGRLGNTRGTTDARTYRGRGFVQITGRSNYDNMSDVLNESDFTYTQDGVTWGTDENPIDLVANPTHVSENRRLAARLLVEGSVGGHYTGRSLSDYINDEGTDFEEARRVINGTDRAEDIAEIAERYAAVLRGGTWQHVFEGNQHDVENDRQDRERLEAQEGETQFYDPTDELRIPPSGQPPAWTLHGSTRRFAALMHIYESGDLGSGGLTPDTVVGDNGMTLRELYEAYRGGRVGCTNAVLDTLRAQELVDSIRQHGWVTSPEQARAAGFDPDDGGFDGISSLRLIPSDELPSDRSIDDTLGFERGIRHFIEHGHVSETREQVRDRRFRSHRLEQLRHDGEGGWTHPDGSELSEDEHRQLRQDLAHQARGTGALRGQALEDYRAYVQDESNPPVDAATWARSQPSGDGEPTDRGPNARIGGVRTPPPEQADAPAEGEAVRRSTLPRDAGQLRTRLRRRMAELEAGDPQHPGRTETQRQMEVVRTLQLMRELDSSGGDPETVERLGREAHAERMRARRESGVVASPTVVVDDAPAADSGGGSSPARRPQQQAPEETEDEDPVVIPRRSLLGGDEEAEGGDDGPVSIGNRSVGVRSQRPDGSSQSSEVSATRTGGQVQTTRQGADGSERSLQAGVNLQHRGDRVVGADVSAGGGGRRFSGELSVGGTYWADPPQRHGDRFLVQWQIEIRGGGSLGARLMRRGLSLNGRGTITRSGTNVFQIARDDRPEEERVREARDRATAFQQEIETYDADRLEREFFAMAGQSLGSYGWWTSDECAVGTQRTVAVGGEVGGSVSARVVSAGGRVRTSDSGTVKKTASTDGQQKFEVTVLYLIEYEVNVGANFGVGYEGGFGLVDNAHLEREAHVYEVTTPEGAEAFRNHLSRSAVMNERMAGVTLKRHTTEEGDLQTDHPDLLIAGFDGRRGVTTETQTDANGQQTVLHRAYSEGSGSSVMGDYFRHNIQFEAPESSNGRYKFTLDHHDTEEGSSGNWGVVEEYSQAQMRHFHTRFLENYERSHPDVVREQPNTHPAGMTIYDRTYRALARVATDQSGDADRAPVIAMMVGTDGERAYRIIRELAGGPCATSTRLFTEEGADDNFMSPSEQEAILGQLGADGQRTGGRIAGWEEQVAAAERAGEPVDGSVTAAIAQELDRMRQRRAAIADNRRYRDVPMGRDEMLGDYDRIISQLEGLHRRAQHSGQENIHQDLDAAEFNEYQAVTRAEGDADRARAAAERNQRRALSMRNPGLERQVGGRWSGAESAMEEGERLRREAQEHLNAARGGQARLSDTHGFDAARTSFERATEQFRTARSLYADILAVYEMHNGRHATGDDEVQGPEGTASTGARQGEAAATERGAASRSSRPSAEVYRDIAEGMGFPEVDLNRATRANGRLFQQHPLIRRALHYGDPVPERFHLEPRYERQVQDALAVARYQRAEGLEVDGIAGAETRRRLLADSEDDREMAGAVRSADDQRRAAAAAQRAARQERQEAAEETEAPAEQSDQVRRDVVQYSAVASRIHDRPVREDSTQGFLVEVEFDRAEQTHASGLVTQIVRVVRVPQTAAVNDRIGQQMYVAVLRIVRPAPGLSRFEVATLENTDTGSGVQTHSVYSEVENRRGVIFDSLAAKPFVRNAERQ